MRIKDPMELKGQFWLVNESIKKFAGTVRVKNGGSVELSIMDTEHRGLANFFSASEDLGRIVGIVERFGDITLDGCILVRRHYVADLLVTSEIYAHTAFFGVSAEHANDLSLDSLEFSVDNLAEWVGITGFRSSVSSDAADIEYRTPNTISYQILPGLELAISFTYKLKSAEDGLWSMGEAVTLNLIPSEPKPFSELRKLAHQITTFLCVATDSAVCLNEIIGRSKEAVSITSRGESKLPIRIVYRSIPFVEDPAKLYQLSIPMTLSMLGSRAGDIFTKWILQYENLAPVIGLYVLSKSGQNEYPEGKFLTMAQCLETLHRRTSTKVYIESGTYQELRKYLVDSCPPEHQKWLNMRLGDYGNEIFLGDRLTDLVRPHTKILGGGQRLEKMKNEIIWSRNYYTHYSAGLKSKALTGAGLHLLYLKMTLIFHIRIWECLGFTSDELHELAKTMPIWRSKLAIFNK